MINIVFEKSLGYTNSLLNYVATITIGTFTFKALYKLQLISLIPMPFSQLSCELEESIYLLKGVFVLIHTFIEKKPPLEDPSQWKTLPKGNPVSFLDHNQWSSSSSSHKVGKRKEE